MTDASWGRGEASSTRVDIVMYDADSGEDASVWRVEGVYMGVYDSRCNQQSLKFN